ncbi:RidA family protein [Mucilaginibacter paludis]|uniref:Endoribonuclease L-PSP n=1 Tax=Mucilaginibacter paludis DSM 18603 TaxID=714943 RepID=H1Y2T9_9SPHI|nr:RidA family protein [Mucilaginibacter paludis]EHQ28268.1 endoribonuclease L-PSP [Mucilaginibacter paludis DSM 18603]
MKTIIKTDKAPAPIGPYNQAILAGNMLFVSGQIALDPVSNQLVLDDIETETKLVMNNIKAILDEASFTFDDVVKSSIFLSDMGTFAKVNEIYGSFFTGNYPARETVQVSVLPKNVNVEISVIAYKG